MGRMRMFLPFAVFAALCFPAEAEQQVGEVTVWQGILVKDPETQRLTKKEETPSIPYITSGDDALFGYGFVLQRRDGQEYIVRSHVTYPAPEGSKEAPKELDVAEKRSAHGVHQTVFTIDAGDPAGVYKVQVFVNDEPITELEFTVQPPGQ